jgi:DNA-binding IclR family transcriptional regulator
VRRVFWLALGLGAGATGAVLAARWFERQTRRMAPANLARQVGGTVRDLSALVGEAMREFRQGMAEKESEFRSSLGTDDGRDRP